VSGQDRSDVPDSGPSAPGRAADRGAPAIDRTDSSPAGIADTGPGVSRGRDRNAARRDAAAVRRDRRAIELEERLAAVDAPAREQFERLRARAAADRAAAAADRRLAAGERTDAAIELSRLRSELNRAYLDDLTGAFGRTLGNQVLGQEIERVRRDDGRLVLACVDVDGLKAINDRAGHPAGDHVLRTLVATTRSSLRPFDPIVRYGSDKFVCAVAGIGIEEVAQRFEEVRRSLYADTGASISIGLAELADRDTLDDVFGRADASLLGAKRARPG
jgi:diguanylate cyclase (GGDEF)-like protein